MDQFISKPLKRFLYNSKEFAKKRRDKNNLNTVQYTAGSNEALINMTEIKSIMRSPQKNHETNLNNLPTTTKQVTKNNVLFSNSIETIDSDGSQHFVSDNEIISENNNSTKLVKVKLINEPVKETATVLNLNPASTNASIHDESDGEIHLDNFARQSIIKIKVKVINKQINDSRTDESNTETVENNSTMYSSPEKSIDKFQNFALSSTDESNSEKTENKFYSINNSAISAVNLKITENDYENKSVELNHSAAGKSIVQAEDDKTTTENVPVVANTSVDSASSIIPAKSIEEFQNIGITENKLDVRESCIFSENKTRPLSPIPVVPPQISPKTNPFRTIDNLIDFHERQVHKPMGRSPPKTLPRMGTSSLLNRSYSKSKLNDSEIISELVRDRFIVNMYESRTHRRSFVKKPSTYGRIYKSLERTVNLYNNDFKKQNLLSSDIVTIKQSSPIRLRDQDVSLQASPVKPPFILEELFPTEDVEEMNASSSNVNEICNQIKSVSISQEELFPTEEDIEEMNASFSNVNEICDQIKSVSISQEEVQPKDFAEEELQKTPSSEYGSGSNSIQNSTISLERHLEQISDSQYDNTFGSEVSSYNMEDFLKKALGDELNNLDTTEISSKTSLPQETSITTSNASDLISKINTFQSSLYRSFTKKLHQVTDTLRLPHGVQEKPQDKQSLKSVKSDLESLFSNNEEVTALLRQAAVQYEALKQISKALTVCRNTKEFCCSSEQVEGERLLLVATHKRQAILAEIRRLEYAPHPSPSTSETGCVTITNITLPLKPSSPEQPRGRDLTKWYVAVFSSGLQVTATQPTPAASDGSVKFVEEVVFRDLPTGCEVNVEVYCLLQRRQGRNFSHESKYHINKETKRSHCPTPKKFLTRDKSSPKNPLYDTGIRTSSFKLSGSLKLTVADLTSPGRWDLKGKIPLCSALQGFITFNLKSVVQIPVKQAGFLTIGSESGGYVAWNRRWCVLDGTVIKYWNYPSEEESTALKEINLKYCVCSKIQTADRSICARPRTLLLEIARMAMPEDSESMMMACSGSYTVDKYYLSADNMVELNVWQEQLDKVVQALRIWNVGFLSQS